jgi:hypothetical protein
MKTLQKTLLISAMLMVPLASVHAQNTGTAHGEALDSSVPAKNPPPTKGPSTTMPAPSGTAQGNAPESSKPGTDKPASKNTPHAKKHKSDMPTSKKHSSTNGKAQQTVPSTESPPGAAPMRSGADARTNKGTGTSIGTEKRQ